MARQKRLACHIGVVKNRIYDTMGTITVTNLGKAYKQYPTRRARLVEWLVPFSKPRHQLKWVLQDLNFKVNPGEAVGIIGINGAGKSTLLKMITGTTRPTTGSVHITGRVAALLELGMGFHPDFTGRQNAFMAGQLLGMSVEEIANLMPEIEAFAEIGEYIDQPVRVYSSGMQVRLAFSVATAYRPDILIIDEALAVGDIFFQQKCFERIWKFREQGTTLLFVSHSLESVYLLCDRALLIEAGRIALNDKTKAVIDLYNARIIQHSNPNPDALRVAVQPISSKSTSEDNSAEVVTDMNDPDASISSSVAIGSYATAGVEIESVNLYVNGEAVESFISESVATIRVRVIFDRACADPHVGFQIRNKRGEAVFVTNTHGMKQQIGPVSAGSVVEVKFSFKASLAEGQYTLTVGVADEGMFNGQFKESLARIQNARAFSVLRNLDSIQWAGMYNLSPTCEIHVVQQFTGDSVVTGDPQSMKLLVTTSSSILVLNTKNGKLRHIHQGDGLYYGITRSDQNIYVAARKRMVSSDIPRENERGEILIFDFDLKLKDRLQAPFPLRDLHEIAWHEGKLWATCSFDNMVAIWDGANWEQWFPLTDEPKGPPDIHHYNSLFFEGGLVSVLAHNFGQSELLSFSLQDRSLTKRIMFGNQAHNIWRESDQLFTCSSGEGMIIGDAGFSLETGGFPRGYASNGRERCVGVSELAERGARDLINGVVQIYDEKWKPKNSVVLEKEGLVLDFLILDEN